MTARILAFIDGSIYSHSVCGHAAWAATRMGAAVDLVHVLGRREAPGKADLSGSIRLGARTALLSELADLDEQRAKLLQQKGRAILEDGRAILEAAGVTDVAVRLRHGDIVETVAEREAGADLILIGKRGEAADFAKLHLGSNLERIVRASTRPILVASRAFKPIARLLIAFDGGKSARKAVDHIAQNPLYAGLFVRIVTAGIETPDAKAAIEGARATLQEAGRDAEAVFAEGQPDQVLSRMMEADGFDLLAMGAYGHSRIRSLVIGSTTTEMLRSCKAPVVLLR